jgi:hypothetical protein
MQHAMLIDGRLQLEQCASLIVRHQGSMPIGARTVLTHMSWHPAHVHTTFIAGEELHGMIARRYGAPQVSLRNTLYDVLLDDAAAQQLLGATRATLMGDPVHPTTAGFKVYADVVAYAVRQTLAAVMANGAANPFASVGAVRFVGGGDLPTPISPVAAQQDADTWCREGERFKPIASCISNINGPASGCKWKTSNFHANCPHDNCKMRGYFLKGQGQRLQFSFDITALAASSTAAGGPASTAGDASSTAGRSSSAQAVQFERRYLAVTYMQGSILSAAARAVATLACVSGCSCVPIQLGFREDANNGIAATEVRHCSAA